MENITDCSSKEANQGPATVATLALGWENLPCYGAISTFPPSLEV